MQIPQFFRCVHVGMLITVLITPMMLFSNTFTASALQNEQSGLVGQRFGELASVFWLKLDSWLWIFSG